MDEPTNDLDYNSVEWLVNFIQEFENTIKEIVGAPYGIATDCCTHAIEVSLRI